MISVGFKRVSKRRQRMSGDRGGPTLKSFDVVAVMERVKASRGVVPQRMEVDNRSEFISKALDKWDYDNQVTLDFSRPGKPTDNPFIDYSTAAFAMNA